MQTVFVFDYSGTLDRLRQPVDFIRKLRGQHPGCRVVLFTGTPKRSIEEWNPGLAAACDMILEKPNNLLGLIGEQVVKVVYVDDEPLLRSMAVRLARQTPTVTWTILEAEALAGLVTG